MADLAIEDRGIVIDTFHAHWTLVDAASTPDFELTGAYGLPEFTTDRDDYADLAAATFDQYNSVQSLSNQLKAAKEEMVDLLIRFRNSVVGYVPDHPWEDITEPVPSRTSGKAKFDPAVWEALSLWGKINANVPPYPGFTPPMIVAGTTLAQFQTAADELTVLFQSHSLAKETYRESLKERDQLWLSIARRLNQYRAAILGFMPPGSPLLETIPVIYGDAEPTPDAPAFSALYDAANEEADGSWTITEDEGEVLKFVVQSAPVDGFSGIGTYSDVADLPPSARDYSIDMSGTPDGLGISMRVRIVMLSGNYATSNSVVITVPPGGPPPP